MNFLNLQRRLNILTRIWSPQFTFIRPYLKTQNLGDVLISRLMIEQIKLRSEVSIIPNNCLENLTQLGLTQNEVMPSLYYSRSSYVEYFVAALRRSVGLSTYVFLSPGHAFSKNLSEKHDSKKRSWLKLLRITAKTYFIKALRLRYCRLGISVGPLNPTKQIYHKDFNKFCYHYSVRENESIDYLRQIGIKNAGLLPDLAWLLPQEISSGKSSILLSFRTSLFGTEGNEYSSKYFNQICSTVLDLCIQLRLKNEHLRQIIITCQIQEDQEFSDTLYSTLETQFRQNGFEITLHPWIRTETEAIQIYSKAAFIISNRLHALLLAYSRGAYPIALIDKENHRKILGIFDLAGMSNHVIDLNETEFDSVQFTEKMDDWAVHENKLRQRFRENSDQIVKAFNHIYQD